jgi:hypothetical protein
MKRYKPVFTKVKEGTEESQSEKAIKDLIDLDWGKDEDAQNTALALLKGLIYADNKVADKFLQDLSDFTSKMKDEKYEEACKKKPKKKGMKEAIRVSNKNQAFEAISEGVNFLIQTNNKNIIQGYLINAIIDGIRTEDDSKIDAAVDKTFFEKRLLFIIKGLKDELR